MNEPKPIGDPSKLVIIGAGPAGLMAAQFLAERHHSVHVYDHKAAPARKFLVAGDGGLNLTNGEDIQAFIERYSESSDRFRRWFDLFSPADLRSWCADLGHPTYIGSSGRVFPEHRQALPVLTSWLEKLQKSGVIFHHHHSWTGWNEDGDLTFDHKGDLISTTAKATVLALGGASWPQTGSTGIWPRLLEERGVTCRPWQSANCGWEVALPQDFLHRFAGQPLPNTRLSHGSVTSTGNLVISQYGLEGGAIYALGPTLRNGLAQGSTSVSIDFLPKIPLSEVARKMARPRGRNSWSNWLRKCFRFSPQVIALIGILRKGADDPKVIAGHLKDARLEITAPRPLKEAISSAGGIALEELNDQLMLIKCPGVFACGEMLDWEAPTGGYLLQGAFTTGAVAAHGVLDYLQDSALGG